MPATKTQLTGGNFQDSEGNVLALGYLDFTLSQDEAITGVGQIVSGITIRVQLDVNGVVVASPAQSVWANDIMSPINGYYRIEGFDSRGQLSWGPNNQQVTSAGVGGGTFDLGTWVPNQIISWTPSLQALLVKVNGVIASNQEVLNFTDNAEITWTIDSGGNIQAHLV